MLYMPIRIIGMTEKQSYNQVQLRKHFDVASDICSEILQFMEKPHLEWCQNFDGF